MSRRVSQHNPITPVRGGFTLMEMLVAVALVLVLMLAVTQIFSIAGKTVGGGQALGVAVRDAQAAQTVLNKDISAAAADGPFFIIRSTGIGAFRNREDLLSDVDQNPLTYDLDGDGDEEIDLNATYKGLNYNFRYHRVDSMAFFARDRYSRQTGNEDTLVANQTANEAVIFVHHLALPRTDGTYVLPGATTGGYSGSTLTSPGNFFPADYTATDAQQKIESNPQNLLASQWILGRGALLLGGTASLGSQEHYYRDPGRSLSPLSFGSTAGTRASLDGGSVNWLTRSSDNKYTLAQFRYDLAGTDIETFRADLENVMATEPDWYKQLLFFDWKESTPLREARFQVDPFVKRPITAEVAANQVPVFVPACTQFIVEFAGDFVTQNADGSLNTAAPNGGYTPDGVIDFVPASSDYAARQIRWYGLPRDTNNDGRIVASEGDVVPLRDVLASYGGTAPPGWTSFPVHPAERVLPTMGTVPAGTDYYSVTALRRFTLPGTSNDVYRPEYVVAFGPSVEVPANEDLEPIFNARPKLIRVTLGIDRPEAQGRLADAQSFEYVFKVGQ